MEASFDLIRSPTLRSDSDFLNYSNSKGLTNYHPKSKLLNDPASKRKAEIDSEIDQILNSIQDTSDFVLHSNSLLQTSLRSNILSNSSPSSLKLSRSLSFPDLAFSSETSSDDSYNIDSSLSPTPPYSQLENNVKPHNMLSNSINDLFLTQINSLRASLLDKNLELKQKDLSISELQASLTAMNDKFVEQVNKTAEMSLSKELVEAELEELSSTLFIEANKMVSDQKRLTHNAEKKIEILERKVNDLLDQLSDERLQCSELKERLQSISENQAVSPSSNSNFPLNQNSPPSSANEIPATISFFSSNFEPISDRQFVKEFYEFANDPLTFKSSKINSSPFMRRSIEEDVEPCLRFGSKPRVSSRYVLDAISSNTLQIEEITPKSDIRPPSSHSKSSIPDHLTSNSVKSLNRNSFTVNTSSHSNRSTIWDRFSGSVPPNPFGCQTCGNKGKCTYRFKLGQKQDEDWISIDTVCRDRLVAVCEFYGFIRLVTNGYLVNRPISELINELTRLKLSMFYSRFGLLSYAISMDPSISFTKISTSNAHSLHKPSSINTSFPNLDNPNSLDFDNYSPTFSLNDDETNSSDPTVNIDHPLRPYALNNRFRSQSATISKPKQLSTRISSMLGSFSYSNPLSAQSPTSSSFPDSMQSPKYPSLSQTPPPPPPKNFPQPKIDYKSIPKNDPSVSHYSNDITGPFTDLNTITTSNNSSSFSESPKIYLIN
ncbi:Rab-3A-interacting protein [Smittium culicis]|uniref:Rab-3A-interacting protein n=1 Tax=Smittium culicis TaxID=133412 RepID=A0A1R1YKV3_9FUNG|nr:Rab-3A-interacting protein [Smittium culicis]OMJ28409.1 Rab-3A-interacting protein [Smittium culicis]